MSGFERPHLRCADWKNAKDPVRQPGVTTLTTMDNEVHSLFDKFLQGKTCKETLSLFHELCDLLHLDPTDYRISCCSSGEFSSSDIVNLQSLVLGAGPCGLRTAIELAFLGAKVIVVEKRESFSRNNVLHLWPFTIHDLRALGAKKFYGKFCSGSLDHISIRQLQLILLKVALILGVEVHVNVEYKGFIKPLKDQKEKAIGWRADLLPTGHPVTKYEFDVFVSAGGGKYVPEGFKKKEMRGKLAIGITANFVNHNTTAEAKVEEISGVAYLYNQKFFQQLRKDTELLLELEGLSYKGRLDRLGLGGDLIEVYKIMSGMDKDPSNIASRYPDGLSSRLCLAPGIDLENIVYYKDDTHYFVMTARKQSLLKYGVIDQVRPIYFHVCFALRVCTCYKS
eukprot:g46345.t1